ncbi:MAG: prefoldin subunit alpha [Candidatus Hodarchaeales archaeon]|jgi:prefoldin alpha subunit
MSKPTISEDVLNRVKILQEETEQLQGNIGAIEQQISFISRVIGSLNEAIKTQNEIKTKKPGDEILVPIGGSNYILCTIKDPLHTFISLGSGINLFSELENSEKRNKQQIESIEISMKQLQEQHAQFSQNINIRRQELLEIAKKYQLA